MFISFRRTGGVLGFLTVAAVALAATLFAVVIGATVLVVALAVAAVALVARVVRPAWSWHHPVPPATPWPHETFEATVVKPAALSDEGALVRIDSDNGIAVNRAGRR
jgi:hypothetical protein